MLYGIQSILAVQSRVGVDYNKTLEEVFQDGLVVLTIECWMHPNHRMQLATALGASAVLGHAMMPKGFDDEPLKMKLFRFLDAKISDANAQYPPHPASESLIFKRALVRSWIQEFREGAELSSTTADGSGDVSAKYWIRKEVRPLDWKPSPQLDDFLVKKSNAAARSADV